MTVVFSNDCISQKGEGVPSMLKVVYSLLIAPRYSNM